MAGRHGEVEPACLSARPLGFFSQPRSRVTAWLFLGGCSPCFMVSPTLAIFQCRTLITNYGSQSWVLNDPRNVNGDRDRIISQFWRPRWLWERSDITAFGESRFSMKPGDLSSFLTRRLRCPFEKMLILNVCLIKAYSYGTGPACQTEAGAKPQWQVRSAQLSDWSSVWSVVQLYAFVSVFV